MSAITSSTSSAHQQQQKESQQQTQSTLQTSQQVTSTNNYSIKKLNTKTNDLKIFLGGSCNPTTWRKNVAIPFLEMNGISYYNPQIDNWTPELVDLERHAKHNAQVLFFVIDKQTRSTVGIVESAFIAGERRNLVLVIYPFDYNIISLTDTQTSNRSNIETRSKLTRTSRALNHKKSSSFKSSSSSTPNSSSSLSSSSMSSLSSSSTTSSRLISASSANNKNLTTTLASASTTTTTLTTLAKMCNTIEKDDTEKRELDHTSFEETLQRGNLQQLSGIYRISGEIIGQNEFLELKQARYILQNLIALQKIPLFSDILQALKYIKCKLSDSDNSSSSSIDSSRNLFLPTNQNFSNNSTTMKRINSVDHNQQSDTTATTTTTDNIALDQKSVIDTMKDIYLSLDSDDQTSIESTVIPILKEKGLTYNYMYMNSVLKFANNSTSTVISPTSSSSSTKLPIDSQTTPTTTNSIDSNNLEQLSRYSKEVSLDLREFTKLALEKEICAIRSSRVLLFVITNKCRGLSIMVLASHFMALFRNNVVLCVQYLKEPCSIGGENLTQTAIDDYNRGRVYLNDYAVQSQVPVFNTIQEAIECCNRKIHIHA